MNQKKLDTLEKLFRLLSSEHVGEVAATVSAIKRCIGGKAWHEFVDGLVRVDFGLRAEQPRSKPRPPPPPPPRRSPQPEPQFGQRDEFFNWQNYDWSAGAEGFESAQSFNHRQRARTFRTRPKSESFAAHWTFDNDPLTENQRKFREHLRGKQ